ncbi:Peptidase M3 [Gracilaria domingensis]|nr:Peptidase M3 [Gracilaria domingensis]
MVSTVPAVEKSDAEAITGPSWQLEYSATNDSQLITDLNEGKRLIEVIKSLADGIKHLVPEAANITPEHVPESDLIRTLTEMNRRYWEAVVLLSNVYTFGSCASSVDGSDEDAKKLTGQVQVSFSLLKQAFQPAQLILDLCPDEIFETYLAGDELAKEGEYMQRHSRKMKNYRLSLAEENTITTLGVTGHSSWGSMYTDLSSVLSVDVNLPDGMKTMGIASAEAMRDSPDEQIRKASWEGIRNAWLPHQETCAAALNAITGWRLDLYEKRGYESFLTSSLHSNRITNATLNALFEALDGKTEVGRRAMRIQAAALGKKALEPWDLFAPAPVKGDVGRVYSFDEGIELIANAVAEVDQDAGSFVRMMRDNKWIEASRGDKKRPGAYCTGFSKSRTPRVYLSDYNGRAQLLLTLAHELGHAFHSWQMRDLPRPQSSYPMNLAETASIFFETVVGSKLLEQAESAEERFSILWGEAESAQAFLLNIPARYRFEEELNKKRKNGKLSTKEVDAMMVSAWEKYYGDALSSSERVGVFSQSKLHFYLTGISFYNWPYSFGYLFALGVYAEYENGNRDVFAKMYRDLLRDTGRMDAEDVVEKHLGGRIDDRRFWEKAISVSEHKVDMLEKVAGEVAAM